MSQKANPFRNSGPRRRAAALDRVALSPAGNGVLRALTAWLTDDSAGSLRIVIGQPGSGKSAVLGRLVELSDPVTRRTLAGDTPPDCLPPVRSVHLELTARGWTLPDLVEQIASEVRLTASSVDELILGLRDRKVPLVVVLDGLNESAEPDLVAHELVGRLADRENGTGLRMVVGSRPTVLTEADVYAMIDYLGAVGHALN